MEGADGGHDDHQGQDEPLGERDAAEVEQVAHLGYFAYMLQERSKPVVDDHEGHYKPVGGQDAQDGGSQCAETQGLDKKEHAQPHHRYIDQHVDGKHRCHTHAEEAGEDGGR